MGAACWMTPHPFGRLPRQCRSDEVTRQRVRISVHSHSLLRYLFAYGRHVAFRTMTHMTNDKFRELCEKVLIPRLGDFMHWQLTDLYRTVDNLTTELLQMNQRLDWIAARLIEREKHEDHR